MSKQWAFFERVAAPDVLRPDKDWMVRWRVIQTPWFGVYVHRINTPDRGRLQQPHTHPWSFLTLIVRGGYTEHFQWRDKGTVWCRWRDPAQTRRTGSLRFVRSVDAHAITRLHRSPTWTIVLAGRRRPEPSWGYWDHNRFIPWNEHPYADAFAAAVAARDSEPTILRAVQERAQLRKKGRRRVLGWTAGPAAAVLLVIGTDTVAGPGAAWIVYGVMCVLGLGALFWRIATRPQDWAPTTREALWGEMVKLKRGSRR